MAKDESFHNLIDLCIQLDEDTILTGNTTEMFRKLLTDYFFRQETEESKKMENFFRGFPIPEFVKNHPSLIDIDVEELNAYIEGSSLKDSLTGRIYISPDYLKAFYPHHAPSFSKLPPSVQEELLQKVKTRNGLIMEAFEKLKRDRNADKSRTILTLVALIIKNVHLKTGIPFNRLQTPSEEAIRSIFNDCDDIFRAKQKQMADLSDDKKVKELVKTFFTVRSFQDISRMADLFKGELARFKKRAMRS